MAKYLDRQAAKSLLRDPATTVFRNPMVDCGVLVMVVLEVLACLFFLASLFFSNPDLRTVIMVSVLLLMWIGFCVAYFIEKRSGIAFTKEGMYLSRVETEDFQGPLSQSRMYVRWDELTELSLSYGPVMSFRVKGYRYGFSVVGVLPSSSGRAQRYQQFVETISSFSGFKYHFSKEKGLTWQYLFILPNRSANASADSYDWESFGSQG